MRRASVGDRAPRTITSTTRVAPSPSRTTRRAISASTPVTARVNTACWRDPVAIRAFPAAPLATWTPIRPVAQGRTAAGATPRSRAASAVDSAAVRSPSAPVQALAFPAWTRTAAARPAATRRRASCTGAAGARFVVNTPATLAGSSAAISATSRPRCFSPARTPAKRNPGTRTRCARRRSLIRRASRLSVALLVLLAAAAGARVVAADLRPVAPDGLDLLQVVRVTAVRERHARRRALATLHRLDLRGQGRDVALRVLDRHPRVRACGGLGAELDAHQLLDDLDLETTHHRLEHVVAFFLVGLERLDLAVAAEPDALLQVVHAEEVVLPEGVQRLEHDELLQVAHDGRAELLLAPVVGLTDLLDEDVLERLHAEPGAFLLRKVQPEVE